MIYYLHLFLILCTTSTLLSLQINGARGLRGRALILLSDPDYNESSPPEELTNLFFHLFRDLPSSLFQGIILIQTPKEYTMNQKTPLQLSFSPVTFPGHVWAFTCQALFSAVRNPVTESALWLLSFPFTSDLPPNIYISLLHL